MKISGNTDKLVSILINVEQSWDRGLDVLDYEKIQGIQQFFRRLLLQFSREVKNIVLLLFIDNFITAGL